ncbi:hypothetical protein [Magnetospirillum sp. ME-1]|uniref:hypothetical protein n=1 Tax=Magnetospirillum sp. ME-1 TaxID=1639348 RepID=UPI0011AE1DDA|nr:hypothetical protein [Magnetospirillum sp. ME-1]
MIKTTNDNDDAHQSSGISDFDDDDFSDLYDHPGVEPVTEAPADEQMASWLDGLNWSHPISQGDLPPQAIIDEIDGLRGRVKGHQIKIGRTHQGLIQILADVYALAHRHRHDLSPILLALRVNKIRVTAATTANPMLPIIRLAMPLDDRRQQSYCARALCALAADGVSPEHAAASISEAGGVDACAKAWAKRQGSAKSTANTRPEIDDPDAPAVNLPDTTPSPDTDGIYLILARRSADGAIAALGHVVDQGLTARVRRRLVPVIR